MVEMTKKEMETSHWWWFDSHHSSLRSPWLQSTLAELDNKTKAMLKVIEEDADSFAQRAEMYYKKRPELISMVEDFYRTHRSLAERYDQLKSDSGNRLLTTLGSPFSAKYQSQKFMGGMDRADDSHSETYELQKSIGGMNRAYDSHSETYEHQKFVCGMNQTYDSHSDIYDLEDSAESEVDDPEQADETQSHQAESCSKQNTIRPRKCKAKHRIADEVKEVADEAGKDPDGEIPNTGPGASGSIISGFGGLGLEGMVGSEDSAGEGTAAPVVGKTGSISGDKLEVGGGEVEEKGGSGKRAGAADIVEYCTCSTSDVKASDEKYAMKITNFAKNDEKEAIK